MKKPAALVVPITERYVILEGAGRQRIANTGQGDLVFLAICTPRFAYQAYEELEC